MLPLLLVDCFEGQDSGIIRPALLCKEHFDRSFANLAEHWRERWLLGRAERVDGWRQWRNGVEMTGWGGLLNEVVDTVL